MVRIVDFHEILQKEKLSGQRGCMVPSRNHFYLMNKKPEHMQEGSLYKH